jgi:tetratricopeptide (TPR) repeat protein
LVDAEAAYREAVAIDPTLAAAYNNLGNVLQDQRRYEEAIAAFRTAARLRPDLGEVHFNLGNCYQRQGHTAEAIAAYRDAVTLQPTLAVAHHALGLLLQSEKEFAAAAECHRRTIALEPTNADAHVALGVALQLQQDFEGAKACYRRVLAMDPDHLAAQYNLASALHNEGDIDEAEGYYRAVLDVVPDHADSLAGLGMIHLMHGDLEQAVACLERGVQVSEPPAEARFFHATLLLSQGKLLEAWPQFESRLECRFAEARRRLPQPRWDGSPLAGRTLLVTAEYGYGDQVQFMRYDPLVRLRAGEGRVLVEAHAQLIPLLQASGYRDLVAQGDALPPIDVQVPMMSLPGIFATTLETIPGPSPYLRVEARLERQWHERLASVPGFKVGIHWQGNPKFNGDRHRSVRLVDFAPLATLPGVTLVGLQKGPGHEQVAELAGQWPLVDLADQLHDFHETAAAMRNLDLVISCDSGPAHVAGALGVPVWVLLSFAPDWRWMRDRDDSPWYPSMRLFRQTRLGDWQGVFERVAAALSQHLGAARH